MNQTFLQIFLLVNVFIVGVLVAIGIQHAYAHFRPVAKEAKKPVKPEQGIHLPTAIREHLLAESQAKFQAVMDRSAAELEHDLNLVTEQIDKHIAKMGSEVVEKGLKQYRNNLDELCSQTGAAISSTQAEIFKKQAEVEKAVIAKQVELEAKLKSDIEEEKKFLINQIDTKIGDAVLSFLTETLGHNVDLGAQSDYLIKTLDEHKAELIKGVADEA